MEGSSGKKKLGKLGTNLKRKEYFTHSSSEKSTKNDTRIRMQAFTYQLHKITKFRINQIFKSEHSKELNEKRYLKKHLNKNEFCQN